jgi:valyl-tRNA synthetase
VAEVLELIRAVRNARAAAGVTASARLPLTLRLPAGRRSAIEAFRPAIERLARAEPLELLDAADAGRAAVADAGRDTAADAVPGPGSTRSLTVVAGALEGLVHLPADAGSEAADAGERARIEKELAQAESALAAARARLADETFLAKAPPHIVEGARTREAELAERVGKLRASLG